MNPSNPIMQLLSMLLESKDSSLGSKPLEELYNEVSPFLTNEAIEGCRGVVDIYATIGLLSQLTKEELLECKLASVTDNVSAREKLIDSCGFDTEEISYILYSIVDPYVAKMQEVSTDPNDSPSLRYAVEYGVQTALKNFYSTVLTNLTAAYLIHRRDSNFIYNVTKDRCFVIQDDFLPEQAKELYNTEGKVSIKDLIFALNVSLAVTIEDGSMRARTLRDLGTYLSTEEVNSIEADVEEQVKAFKRKEAVKFFLAAPDSFTQNYQKDLAILQSYIAPKM